MTEKKDLFVLFRQIAEEVEKKPLGDISRQSVIADLGIDSLSMMQIVGEMESQLGVLVPDDQLVKLVTVNDLIGVVEKHMEQGA